jgi:chorismate mutase
MTGKLTGLAALFCLLIWPQVAFSQSSAEEELVELITARLAVMKEVAAFKLANNLAVEDKPREAVVLAKSREKAEATGLDGPSVTPFFRRQIEAAKSIQVCWFARWQSGGASPQRFPRDLKSEIRPQLIELGARLTAALGRALENGHPLDAGRLAGLRPVLALDCLSEAEGDAVFASLAAVKGAAP